MSIQRMKAKIKGIDLPTDEEVRVSCFFQQCAMTYVFELIGYEIHLERLVDFIEGCFSKDDLGQVKCYLILDIRL